MIYYLHLECHHCGEKYDKTTIQNFCKKCTQPLLAKYHLERGTSKDIIYSNRFDMWRYAALLPVEDANHIITLGEGWTPMLALNRSKNISGIKNLYLKEEGLNPTGSFKARGISLAVSKASELGISAFCIPTAGNAGSALAAYVAAIGGEAHIFMPEATPQVFQLDCEVMGAKVVKVPGSIRDAGLAMTLLNENGQWWDITTLKEPFRLEGKKTLGFEIAEQLQWKLPDMIIYPTGGGTGLIGIWKAFQEMLELGWIDNIPTKMVAVQTEGCNPVVLAYKQGKDCCELCENPAETIANGLRVPKAFGDRLIMKTIYESHGFALDVTEEEIKTALFEFGKNEGIFLSPEGAAVYAGYKKLIDQGIVQAHHTVVLINTGSPYKYVENL